MTQNAHHLKIIPAQCQKDCRHICQSLVEAILCHDLPHASPKRKKKRLQMVNIADCRSNMTRKTSFMDTIQYLSLGRIFKNFSQEWANVNTQLKRINYEIFRSCWNLHQASKPLKWPVLIVLQINLAKKITISSLLSRKLEAFFFIKLYQR